MARESAFIVEVQYREPGCEIRNGVRSETYRFRYRITAPTAELAALNAMEEFRRVTALSGVGWVREVVCCDVALAAAT